MCPRTSENLYRVSSYKFLTKLSHKYLEDYESPDEVFVRQIIKSHRIKIVYRPDQILQDKISLFARSYRIKTLPYMILHDEDFA